MSKSDDTYIVVILALALIAVITLWQFQGSPQDAYERGSEDGYDRGWLDGFDVGLQRRLFVDSTDTMPAVEETTYVDTFYKCWDGVWRIEPIIIPDTGGVR